MGRGLGRRVGCVLNAVVHMVPLGHLVPGTFPGPLTLMGQSHPRLTLGVVVAWLVARRVAQGVVSNGLVVLAGFLRGRGMGRGVSHQGCVQAFGCGVLWFGRLVPGTIPGPLALMGHSHPRLTVGVVVR